MKSIGIFYFSGTGNTELVSRLIAEAFERRAAKVDLIRIEDILHGHRELHVESYDFIGIGHPVLGLGATGIAYRFAEQLPLCAGQKTFIFKVAGDLHYINHGASKPIIKMLSKKGYEVFHDSIFPMACNWFFRYDDRLIKQLYEAVIKNTDKLAEEILSLTPRQLKLNPILNGFCRATHYMEENHGAKYFSKGLKASEGCVGCKKCINSCPMKNISEKAGKPAFGRDCILCMRCIYICPQNAIHPSRLSHSEVKPYNGGFNIQTLLDDPSIDNVFVTSKTKGYYKRFHKYFMDI